MSQHFGVLDDRIADKVAVRNDHPNGCNAQLGA
jgi:hypothetical protein